jgi:hypothetical protein
MSIFLLRFVRFARNTENYFLMVQVNNMSMTENNTLLIILVTYTDNYIGIHKIFYDNILKEHKK